MQQFQRMNNLVGWLVFAFATAVYLLSMEATASFWDCGEFISAAHKLQVVHPPGAPIFLMVGRLFIVLGGGAANAATMMNVFSALSSSFSILFLFWSITYFAQKVLAQPREAVASGEDVDVDTGVGMDTTNMAMNKGRSAAAIGAGLIGAGVGTFMTSLWFSAVEAEVYALATFFYALIFWAMTKWDRVADHPDGDRWLLFIALMVGMAGGSHLLSLLVLPAVVFMYYFRKFEVTPKGVLAATGVALGSLIFILYFVLDAFVAIAAKLDVAMVNGMGLPFGTGIVLFSIVAVGGLAFGIRQTAKNGTKWLNTALLSVVFLLMGFSSYAMVLVRASAEPSINMNGITDVHSFLSYLKREQYGSRSLFKGTYFTARPLQVEDGAPIYRKGEDDYELVGHKQSYVYDVEKVYGSQFQAAAAQQPELRLLAERNKETILPRMGSPEGRHLNMYYAFLGLDQQAGENYVPNFRDNMRFMFSYQFGHMFWRYFMWNFSGRQNDDQGFLADGYKNGNWITGLPFIDQAKHPQLKDLPYTQKQQQAYDRYFLLPFILGLLGMVWQFRNDRNGFVIVFLFWLFMGIINIVNMNQPPIEPRERDYALVGAFFAFAMWVGMGLLALWEIGKKRMAVLPEYAGGMSVLLILLFIFGLTRYALTPWIYVAIFSLAVAGALGALSMGLSATLGRGPGRAWALTGVLALVPLLMGFQNWDNHDRSNRTFARDVAGNYLESCLPNAILFTQGDNDTYPLWYAQEVEGIRTDIRIINLSLLGVDWYINTLRKKVNDAPAIPMTLTREDVQADNNVFIEWNEESPYKDRRIEVDRFVASIRENPNPYVPTKKISIPVDRQKVIESGMVTEDEIPYIPNALSVNLAKRNLYKNDLMVLDIIGATDWDRPIYFAMTVQTDAFLGLQKYFRHDGMCYQFSPVEKPDAGGRATGYRQSMNTDVMYDIIMSDKFRFGGVEKGEPIYRDPSAQNAILTVKYLLFQQLAFDLIAEADRAEQVARMLGAGADSIALGINLETGSPADQAANKRAMAGEVLDRMLEKFPPEALPYDINMLATANLLADLGKTEQSVAVLDETAKVVGAELDWLLTLNGETSDNTWVQYLRELFGGQPAQGQLTCAGPGSLQRMGTMGTAASIILLYEDLDQPEKAEAFRAECAASFTSHQPIQWAPYIHQSCKRLIQQTFGVGGAANTGS